MMHPIGMSEPRTQRSSSAVSGCLAAYSARRLAACAAQSFPIQIYTAPGLAPCRAVPQRRQAAPALAQPDGFRGSMPRMSRLGSAAQPGSSGAPAPVKNLGPCPYLCSRPAAQRRSFSASGSGWEPGLAAVRKAHEVTFSVARRGIKDRTRLAEAQSDHPTGDLHPVGGACEGVEERAIATIGEHGGGEDGAGHRGPTQTGFPKVGAAQVGTAQVHAGQVIARRHWRR